jgi:hypothetical protein
MKGAEDGFAAVRYVRLLQYTMQQTSWQHASVKYVEVLRGHKNASNTVLPTQTTLTRLILDYIHMRPLMSPTLSELIGF